MLAPVSGSPSARLFSEQDGQANSTTALMQRVLRGFHLSRQLRLIPQFEITVTQNALVNPLFHACLTEEARLRAEEQRRGVEAVLQRHYPHPRVGEVPQHRSTEEVPKKENMACAAPEGPSRGTSATVREESGVKEAMPQPTLVLEETLHTTSRSGGTDEEASRQEMERERGERAATLAKQRLFEIHLLVKRIFSFMAYPELPTASQVSLARAHALGDKKEELQDLDIAANNDGKPLSTFSTSPGSGAGGVESGGNTSTAQMFYVAPLPLPHTTGEEVAGRLHHTTKIFVRFAWLAAQMGEETLNTFFGRYGQVSCTRCRVVRLLDCNIAPAVVDLLSTAFSCHPSQVFLQDFIIHVDSVYNAIAAVNKAYYKELLFIALSDDSQNLYGPSDVDSLLQGFLPYRWDLYALPLQLPEERTAADNAEAAAAAPMHHRHKRRRTHRFRELLKSKRRRRVASSHSSKGSISSSEAESSSSSSSSSDISSSGSGSGSTLSSNSSSSSETDDDAETRDGHVFVPDVVIHGLPYWATLDQIKVLLQGFGSIKSLRLSLDDRNGTFMGAVLVGMSTPMEALHLSESLHQYDHQGYVLTSGILTPRLDIVSLLTGEVREKNNEELPPGFSVSVNERLWV